MKDVPVPSLHVQNKSSRPNVGENIGPFEHLFVGICCLKCWLKCWVNAGLFKRGLSFPSSSVIFINKLLSRMFKKKS